VLGFPTELVDDQYNTTYFNRTDVKKAFHAPMNISWSECAVNPVFVGGPVIDGYPSGGPQGEGDTAPDPIQHVLPQVIEATNRVLIGNGDFDMIIITNVSSPCSSRKTMRLANADVSILTRGN
jgi:carboxypeptidase D